MQYLELLAPARNADIGIAAIACGADAVYIGGPLFGARKDAGNDLSEIGRLCDYAHRYGARVFLTVNVTVREEEWEELHRMMLEAQRLGVDAFIVRDIRIATWADITVPVHASTQCAIRTAEQAQEYARQGFSRIVLERELSLAQVRQIAASTEAEIECFVHGALCVGYSGDCYLSEVISGRSANRGECIQACRSLYDLVDGEGRILLKDKALLSLKDLNLLDRLGACSRAKLLQRFPGADGSTLLYASLDQLPGFQRVVAFLDRVFRNTVFAEIKNCFERIGHRPELCPLFSGHRSDPS